MQLWMVGEWQPTEIRTVAVKDRQVTVFGPCAATNAELHRLVVQGVPDRVMTAFSGSYTVVEYTPHRTTVFTDPGHAWPIYTADTGRGIAWGSSSLALAALTNVQPDTAWLAKALLMQHRPGLITGRSAFCGITSIPPGSRMVLDDNGGVQVRAAWQPEPARIGLADGAELLRTGLSSAVATRIDSSRRPSADCSGGLDSTSLALLAAARLDRQRSLHAVTVHPAGITRGGDLDYASAATEDRPAITHLLCPLDSRHVPYSRMVELTPPTDEPAPTTIAIARAVAEFDLLRELGSDCHLTGDGGDTLLGGHPAYLADLAQDRRIGLLFRHAVGWARLRRTSVWPLVLDACASAAHRHRRAPRGRRGQHLAAWATPLARHLATETTPPRCDPRGSGSVDTATQLAVDAIQMVGRTARSDAQIAEHYGVHVHNPFTDPQVLAAVLSVPGWLRASPYRYKPLLATALGDLLPPVIAARQTKGDFTPDHYLGLRVNAMALRELADGRLAELGLVDPDRLRRQLVHVEAGLPVSFSDFEPVLAAEVWLRTVETTPPVARWQPTGEAVGSTAS
jgi:asparagine synthase (glutamine-hydrolysing)